MMRGTTAPRFIWKSGIEFPRLARLMVEYFRSAGKNFADFDSSYRFRGIFHIYRHECEKHSEYSNTPWDEDPWAKNETTNISWIVMEGRRTWGSFYVKREFDQPFVEQGCDSDRVHMMVMFFDGRLWAPLGESEAEFQGLVEKYNRIKELFSVLDCDQIVAWDEYFIHEYAWQARFPFHRDKLFRFAKEGTQVLVRRMEERSISQPVDWLHSRIFLDPPGLQALSPEQYAKLNPHPRGLD